MQLAGAAGLDPAATLDMTLFELSAYQRGRADSAQDDLMIAGWHAWHAANLTRAKKLPALKKWMAGLRRTDGPPVMSVSSAISAMHMEALAAGLPRPKPRKLE